MENTGGMSLKGNNRNLNKELWTIYYPVVFRLVSSDSLSDKFEYLV